ncbi:sensor histidine kinase [Desulfonatronum thioautotrophicum]|uniref:sensor histidine kinase n=1 Tax=Desulfonatronum thioautotrophicum TaxID=617001 RepID=UPI00069BF8D0|nr:HAMP domain-containing sensor histidine kinase [Desulfonatronum thioautotrophicum]
MNRSNQRDVIALLCDDKGFVREVLADERNRFENVPAGLPFTAFVHPTSLTKARNFFKEIQEKGIVLDWELGVATTNKVTILQFTGVRHERQTIIVGAEDSNSVMELYEEILSMHGDQITLLRSEVKRRKELADELHLMNLQGYEEVTRLNNELVTMQRDLVKKTRELEALNQQKNLFLGIAAHDLRNPIGNILNLSQLLQGDLRDKLNDDSALYFQLIDSSCGFLLQLISDLLDFSQIESGKLTLELETVDLEAVVSQQTSFARTTAQTKGVGVSFTTLGEGPFITQGDRGRLTQVVDNLISNAVKFSNAQTLVEVSLARKEKNLLLTVQDHGPGISPEDQVKLFQPFAKASSRPTAGERSTGLGLSIVKRIVDAHGGEIRLESSPGQGTALRVCLPVGDTVPSSTFTTTRMD